MKPSISCMSGQKVRSYRDINVIRRKYITESDAAIDNFYVCYATFRTFLVYMVLFRELSLSNLHVEYKRNHTLQVNDIPI